jgi:hypothetical protein
MLSGCVESYDINEYTLKDDGTYEVTVIIEDEYYDVKGGVQVEIPSSHKGIRITSIGEKSFSHNSDRVEEITLSRYIKEIKWNSTQMLGVWMLADKITRRSTAMFYLA